MRAAGEEEVAGEGLGDVENFYLVLKPHGGRFRLIHIGRKRLPDMDGHERQWGFVEAIADSGRALEEGLRRETYDTKTRGERVRPTAPSGGRGRLRDLVQADSPTCAPAG